ncbi:AP2 domain protein [Planctomycetes bacterium K23_9]|uniref:AP2 domain protein n=2 Tax=Stieleria marina TaxID=1930275 RepID=A0A517NYG5_9BACT|nr:AP2 domain protein [Planctomycetes bacterium K23_9]
MHANRNITRINRQSTGGYLVRITRKGKLRSKYFADVDGGKRKALQEARLYRDELESKMRGYSSKQLAKKERADNTSGYPGVRKATEADPRWPSNPCYNYWIAQWSPSKGVRRTRRFSVEKYGEEEAFRLAVQARKRGVASME